MTTLTRNHTFAPPAPGHVDGNRCASCGYGPGAPQHAEPDAQLQQRVTAAHQMGRDLRAELARMTGEDGGRADHILAYVDGRVARLLGALDGDTRPAPFHEASRRAGTIQHQLPLSA